MFAAVSSDVNLTEYAEQAFLFLVLLGGAILLLGNLVLGGNSFSSGPSSPRRSLPPQEPLRPEQSAPKPAPRATAAKMTPTGSPRKSGVRERRASLRRPGNPVGV